MRRPSEETRTTGELLIQEQKPEGFKRQENTEMFINIVFPELTWKCPVNAYPDFAKITIRYIPNERILELRSLKLWLNSFRDKYIGHEKIGSEIFETLWETISPMWMKIILDINPRGNMKDYIIIERGKKK